MKTGRVLRHLTLLGGILLGPVAALYLWLAISTWHSRSLMSPEARAEWASICSVPSMDCKADPNVWLRLALLFGLPALVLVTASRFLAPPANQDRHRGTVDR